jgi:hypothetical protein
MVMCTKRCLETEFPEAVEKLKQLIPNARIGRLNEIFNVTEEKWEKNIGRLTAYNAKVKYLLIGEAAPYTEEGEEVKYFYNEALRPSWRTRVYKAFFKDSNTTDPETQLQAIAQRGFLLIDVLPFSENYSGGRRPRNKRQYQDLIELCAGDYFGTKLEYFRIQWDSDVEVAFGIRLTCRTVKRVLESFVLPNGQVIFPDEDTQTVGDTYGNLRTDSLKRVFKL